MIYTSLAHPSTHMSQHEEELHAADERIAAAQKRIAQVQYHLDRRRAAGLPCEDGQRLLNILIDSLQTMLDHRRIIRREVDNDKRR